MKIKNDNHNSAQLLYINELENVVGGTGSTEGVVVDFRMAGMRCENINEPIFEAGMTVRMACTINNEIKFLTVKVISHELVFIDSKYRPNDVYYTVEIIAVPEKLKDIEAQLIGMIIDDVRHCFLNKIL